MELGCICLVGPALQDEPLEGSPNSKDYFGHLLGVLNNIQNRILRGDIIGVLISILVILFVIYGLNRNETMFGVRVVDIVGLIIFVFVIITTGVYINNKIPGLKKYLPACHDFVNEVRYCARHRGFHLGLIFWVIFGFLVVYNCFIEIACLTLTINPFLRWIMLLLLLATPAHGWLTKIGFKLSDFDRFLTAFFWGLIIVFDAFLVYKWLLSPC